MISPSRHRRWFTSRCLADDERLRLRKRTPSEICRVGCDGGLSTLAQLQVEVGLCGHATGDGQYWTTSSTTLPVLRFATCSVAECAWREGGRPLAMDFRAKALSPSAYRNGPAGGAGWLLRRKRKTTITSGGRRKMTPPRRLTSCPAEGFSAVPRVARSVQPALQDCPPAPVRGPTSARHNGRLRDRFRDTWAQRLGARPAVPSRAGARRP